MRENTIEPGRLTPQTLIPHVNEALKSCQSVLALSRSPLASSRIVQPALVRDDVSPTAEERSHALFLALRWAVEKLAPGPVAHPFGEYRPFDDPTWQEPRWWRYNILRHRYLEPLHPDDFVDGARYTDTLLALTGIPNSDSYFDERARAIRETAQWLHRQLETGDADAELMRLALQEAYVPLRRDPAAAHLLEIAATFADVFPRAMLIEMAAAEGIQAPAGILERLVRRRYLLGEPRPDGNEWPYHDELWMAPALRQYVYQRSEPSLGRIRHGRAAQAFEKMQRPLAASKHYLRAGEYERAARLLMAAHDRVIEELEVEELRQGLAALPVDELAPELAYAVLSQVTDLHRLVGDHDAAVAACRSALTATDDPRRQAQIYRRLAKLYEKRNQSHAMNYYRQAIDRFEEGDPELVELRKDRGWLHILRRNWIEAEEDLTEAIRLNDGQSRQLEADIYDALSSLRRRQQDFASAIDYGQRSLALRETLGDPLRIANSLGNLGLIYNDQGDYAHAIAAFEEAAVTYQRLGNQEYGLTATLNVGLAQHLSGQLQAAVVTYLTALEAGMEIGHHLTVVTTHSNLAEAYATLGETERARSHWQAGYELSQRHGFDDEISYYVELSTQIPALQGLAEAPVNETAVVAFLPPDIAFVPADLDPDEARAWEIAREAGSVTAKALMEETGVSKPTATRKLSALVSRGLLTKRGQGRGTYYAPVTDSRDASTPSTDVARISQRLQSIREALRRDYGVTGLAVVEGETTLPGCVPGVVNILVRFQSPPDLMAFFGLEGIISGQCGQPINLAPVMAATDRDGEGQTGLVWLWA